MGGKVLDLPDKRFYDIGIEDGILFRDKEKISEMLRRGKTVDEIVDFCGYEKELVEKIDQELRATV